MNGDATNTAANTPAHANVTAPSVRRRHWLLAWLAAFGLFTLFAHGNFETTDAGFTMYAARGLWQRGDSGLRTAEQGGDTLAEQLGAAELRLGKSGKVGTNDLAYPWFPVGHVWLMVPFVAAGDWLERAAPAAPAAFQERALRAGPIGMTSVVQGTPLWTQGLVSLLVPPACAASLLLLLFALARRLGADGRAAAHTALAIVLGTQAFAFGRETLSDGPGLVCLLAATFAVVTVHRGGGTNVVALVGGLAGGAAVLLRYQNAALLAAVGLALGLAVWRQRRWPLLATFTLGVLPAAALLLAVDHARFGDPFDTGYPKAADWLDQPLWLGVGKQLFAAGRGVAWLSPLVWLALPFSLRARDGGRLRWLGWAVFLFPLCFFGLARGWQGGQCWGARYVTHGLVLLLALTLPVAQPWRRWPRTWFVLLLLGLFANATAVVAPVRGVIQLADQAYRANGGTGDHADPVSWQPRYTPLLANWRYAMAAASGAFEDVDQRPRTGSPAAIERVFGTTPRDDVQAQPPLRWEDRGGRHLFVVLWGELLGVPCWLLALPGLALMLAGRRAVQTLRALPPSESSTPA